MLAYSDGDRGYAAICLGCFGPSFDKGLVILEHLAKDPEASVRRIVVKALRWCGHPKGRQTLASLFNDSDSGVENLARSA
ncbi:unnamed protein product, partial [Phaeothamnion confervicola]